MGSDAGQRQGGEERPIAAFDFDGTLTVRDSFMAFLRQRVSAPRFALGALRLGPATLGYVVDRDRERIKAAAVKEFLEGLSLAELDVQAQVFADRCWDKMMRPDALETWDRWGKEGVQRVIVTASPAAIVAPFARRLHADLLIGTKLATDASGRITGAFDSPNCRAAEKVVRLKAEFGEGVRLVAAYGDTSGDTEMIAMAEEKGYRVFKARP
jgi:phosphatidylglycerophosphatase C